MDFEGFDYLKDVAATKDEVQRLENTFSSDFALKIHLVEIKEELVQFVKQQEFKDVEEEMNLILKNIKRFSTREELASRLQLITMDLNDKLNDRPTMNYFKRFQNDFGRKMNDHIDYTKEQFNILNQQQQD